MRQDAVRWMLMLAVALGVAVAGKRAGAQGPTIESRDAAHIPTSTSLGPLPGSGGSRGGAPADMGIMLGGRPGASVPRVPTTISTPGPEPTATPGIGIVVAPSKPVAEAPPYGALALPETAQDDGPPDGLTLDAAISRLVAENLDLRTLYHEIPKSRADQLTASLRANPIFYADGQLVPYGSYSDRNPGGPIQYDVNISYPLDVSHKRRARMAVACQVERVLEAQFQDAVRQKIDALYTTFVNILAARESLRYARASVSGLARVLEKARSLQKAGEKGHEEVDRIERRLIAAPDRPERCRGGVARRKGTACPVAWDDPRGS
jgi:cobalt-zinc-cadmium efflux system outer membrane protein